jgi:DDE superfamily endonuclease
MRRRVAARPRLTTCQLPAYAPEFNPVEGLWSHLKRTLADLAVGGVDQLGGLVKTRLRQMRYRPGRIDGFLARTGLDLQPP